MTIVNRYQNSILTDALDVMSTEDLLEFAVECDWLRNYLGETAFLQIKQQLLVYADKPWRDALESAKKSVAPGLTAVARS